MYFCLEYHNTERTPNTERTQMNNMLLKLYVQFQNLMILEEGQDLVEYALVVALIVLGVVATMRTLATSISTEFSVLESIFNSTA